LGKDRVQLRTLLALVVLEDLHGTEGSGTGKGLVAEAGLVLLEVVALDLVIGVLRFSCGREERLAGGKATGKGQRGWR
jgi:hypothetical protein